MTESEEINGTSTELTQRFYLPHTPASRRRLADSAASPPVQTFNLSGLHPATQYRCSVRMLPSISPYLPRSPQISPYLPISPTPPYISVYLPTSP